MANKYCLNEYIFMLNVCVCVYDFVLNVWLKLVQSKYNGGLKFKVCSMYLKLAVGFADIFCFFQRNSSSFIYKRQ